MRRVSGYYSEEYLRDLHANLIKDTVEKYSSNVELSPKDDDEE